MYILYFADRYSIWPLNNYDTAMLHFFICMGSMSCTCSPLCSAKQLKFNSQSASRSIDAKCSIVPCLLLLSYDEWVCLWVWCRRLELKSLKGRKYLDALCVYFWATTPVLISILTFATYVAMGHTLTAAKVSSHRAVAVGYIHGTACVVLYICAWEDCVFVRFYSFIMLAAYVN